jgi:hypothetical protein
MGRRLILLLSIAVLSASGARAATGDLKPKRPFIPPAATAADDGLRGPLKAEVLAPPQLAGGSSAGGLPATGAALPPLGAAGLSKPPLIAPLPAAGDGAPICRAACAEAKIACGSSDESSCDAPWARCVAGCSDSTATDASGKS